MKISKDEWKVLKKKVPRPCIEELETILSSKGFLGLAAVLGVIAPFQARR